MKSQKCPVCNKAAIKYGTRKTKLQQIQVYLCKSCSKRFSITTQQNKTYPLSIILNSISNYNLGCNLKQTSEKIEKNYETKVPISTISSWLNQYKSICTFHKLRKEAIKLHQPKSIIYKQTLSHIQPYTFKYHKAKLYLLFHSKLYNNQFHNISLFYEPLKNYLEKISTDKFPHRIFTYSKDNASSPIVNEVDAENGTFSSTAIAKDNNLVSMENDKNSNETIKNSLNAGAGQNVKDSASGPDAVVAKININNVKNENNKIKNGNFGTGHHLKDSASGPDAEIANINNDKNLLEQRASQIKFNHLKIETKDKNNFACKLAALALNLASTNKERHQKLQDFFLINDSTTIAIEMPIYLTNWDAGYYRNQKGFIFPLNNYQTPITGHIDLLQIRNGMLHIIDYKPDASKINAVEQLTIYAMALSRKLNLPLYYFKCAWFDENSYKEFFPLHAVYPKKEKLLA